MRNRRDKIERGSLLLGVAIAAITAPLSPVFAQTVDGADAGVAANEQGEVQTNEILVTANRREQNIQDIAISVSALGERDIERFNVQSGADLVRLRSEEHTSELQSLMRISYAVFCLKKKNTRERTKQ